MSRRSRIATVVRVAEIRETAARAQVAAATRDRNEARQAHADRQAELAGTTVTGGSVTDLLRSVQVQGLRADATAAAAAASQTAEASRDDALSGWTAAANRARLLRDLATRQQAEQAAFAERSTQKVLDDLSAARATGGAS